METFTFEPLLDRMWKLILVLVLVIYVLHKISMVLFRVVGRPQPPPPPFNRQHDTGNTLTNKLQNAAASREVSTSITKRLSDH